jgi:hypothetical protein
MIIVTIGLSASTLGYFIRLSIGRQDAIIAAGAYNKVTLSIVGFERGYEIFWIRK